MLKRKIKSSMLAMLVGLLCTSNSIGVFAEMLNEPVEHNQYLNEVVVESVEKDKIGQRYYENDRNYGLLSGSFNGWSANGFIKGSMDFVQTTNFDEKHKWFWGTSATIVSGTNYTYTWDQRVSKTDYSGHTVTAEISGEGKVPLVGEIEAKGGYEYAKNSTKTVERGQVSQITINEAGHYQFDWYMRAMKYDMYCDWLGWTYDNTTTRPIRRYVGQLLEPTQTISLFSQKLP